MRDFEQDRKICEALGDRKWTFEKEQDGFASGIWSQYGCVAEFVDEPDKVNIDFIVGARDGWPAALDEVKRLSENIHAYAYESGRVSLKCQDQSIDKELKTEPA